MINPNSQITQNSMYNTSFQYPIIRGDDTNVCVFTIILLALPSSLFTAPETYPNAVRRCLRAEHRNSVPSSQEASTPAGDGRSGSERNRAHVADGV